MSRLKALHTQTELRRIREQRGVSAAQLAKLTGVSRQTIYSIEAGEYVPNTALALQLAKILEVRVEDLFQLESEPAPPPKPVTVELLDAPPHKGQPVQICRVGKKSVAIAATAQPFLLPASDGVVISGSRSAAKVQTFPNEPEGSRLLVAGCDPGISLLAQPLARYENIELLLAPSSSVRALEWLKHGLVHVAGSHLRDRSSGEYNLPEIRRLFRGAPVKVVTFAMWEQGIVVAAGNPKNIGAVEDLARRDVRIVNREPGAGSRDLLDERLKAAGIAKETVKGYDRVALGHLPAALAVSRKEADACIATRSAARAFGLGFVALAVERYDLVVTREFARTAAVEALFDTLNRSAVRRKLETIAGYDTTRTGEVLMRG